MKQTKLFIPTLKEIPAEAEAKSHQLMLKGGYIRQNAAGIYDYLPLAKSVLNKIEAIIRKEMDKIDANEISVSHIIPAEYWQESGRYETYGPELYKFKNRDDRDFILGPTHEETFTKLISEVKSYKKFPLTLYQIQTKFRDEKRPRFGILRSREFIMKDAYSFSADQEGLDIVYDQMSQAYQNVFSEIGLKYLLIEADSGAMGGSASQEFNALAEIGEDLVAYTDGGYAANIEKAEEYFEDAPIATTDKQIEVVDTPKVKTAQEVSGLLEKDLHEIAKSMVFKTENGLVLIVVPGDYEVNDVKVKNYLGVNELEPAPEEDIYQQLGVHIGSIGAVDVNIPVYIDRLVTVVHEPVFGANVDGQHLINVDLQRDIKKFEVGDFVIAKEGNMAADQSGAIKLNKGIEVGHIFKLGTRYSKAMKAQVQGEDGSMIDLIMGSYGIGVSRLLSAIIEQNNDENGIMWPKNIAPYDIHLIPINYDDDTQKALTDDLYNMFVDKGYEVLVDDRKERPGVKFADSDLIGSPIRITVGRDAGDRIVEFKHRSDKEASQVKLSADMHEVLENF